jgi:hypothetical protein
MILNKSLFKLLPLAFNGAATFIRTTFCRVAQQRSKETLTGIPFSVTLLSVILLSVECHSEAAILLSVILLAGFCLMSYC